MSRQHLFSSPFMVGFDDFERALERITRSASDGYPPYNVERTGDHRLRITVAVAGFDRSDLAVTVENNELLIAGRHEDAEDRTYLHRGIATRQFQRRFVLADGIQVTDARLENGLLHVDLARPEQAETTRTIDIQGG